MKKNENRDELEIVEALVRSIDKGDSYTRGHCERVKYYSIGIASEFKITDEDLMELKLGALFHDFGKLYIPKEILNKEGKLTDIEYAIIKKHPIIGFNILKRILRYKKSLKIILEHHERIDGKGYPFGIIGRDIDFLSSIVMVADAFDAMTTSRVYRKVPLPTEQALAEISINTGKQFEPKIVDAFFQWIKKNGNNKITRMKQKTEKEILN